MPDVEYVGYRRTSVVVYYIMSAFLVGAAVFSPWRSTYFRLLESYPGRYILYIFTIVAIAYLIWRLPIFFRALLGIPALELGGNEIIIRGWNDFRSKIDACSITYSVDSDRRALTVFSDGNRVSKIHLSDIDGPKTLISILDRIASSSTQKTTQ